MHTFAQAFLLLGTVTEQRDLALRLIVLTTNLCTLFWMFRCGKSRVSTFWWPHLGRLENLCRAASQWQWGGSS